MVLQPLQPQEIVLLDGSTYKNRIASAIASIASGENLLKLAKTVSLSSNDRMQRLQRMQDRLQSQKTVVKRLEKAKIGGCNGCNAISQTKRGRK
jgi:hypothetical protein